MLSPPTLQTFWQPCADILCSSAEIHRAGGHAESVFRRRREGSGLPEDRGGAGHAQHQVPNSRVGDAGPASADGSTHWRQRITG